MECFFFTIWVIPVAATASKKLRALKQMTRLSKKKKKIADVILSHSNFPAVKISEASAWKMVWLIHLLTAWELLNKEKLKTNGAFGVEIKANSAVATAH